MEFREIKFGTNVPNVTTNCKGHHHEANSLETKAGTLLLHCMQEVD